MTDASAYDDLISLTHNNRSLIEQAGVGVCLACHAISPFSLIVNFRDDSAVCPQCDRTALVPAWTTALLDDVGKQVFGAILDAKQSAGAREQEDAITTAIHGEIFPLMTRIEQRTGQKLMPALWAALTRALASLGATEDQLKQGVEVQVRSQQELGRRRKH
jgi:hypothetical protein